MATPVKPKAKARPGEPRSGGPGSGARASWLQVEEKIDEIIARYNKEKAERWGELLAKRDTLSLSEITMELGEMEYEIAKVICEYIAPSDLELCLDTTFHSRFGSLPVKPYKLVIKIVSLPYKPVELRDQMRKEYEEAVREVEEDLGGELDG
jgi:hypothetical protein